MGIDKIEIGPNPQEEILIEVPENELARLNMSMNDISNIIASTSINVPAGTLADGALRVRSLGLKEIASDYAQIEILVKPDGTRVLLGDIARISEAFTEPSVQAFRNGKTKLLGFFVGQLMKRTKGKADPKLANKLLTEKLNS